MDGAGPGLLGLYRRTLGSSRFVLVCVALGLAAGVAAWWSGRPGIADLAWTVTTAIALIPLTISVLLDLLRRELGVDVIALLAMGGALAFGQPLAGAVVALMLSGGLSLESYAQGRASRELRALLARAPRMARVRRGDDLQLVAAEEVRRGDLLLMGSGEVLPVDGVVAEGIAVLDEAALTGESRPVERRTGDLVRSGAVNAGGPFDLRATATVAESTYAGIVRLVQEAQASKAPFVRLADRYAAVFLPLTLAIAAAAGIASRDPVRALAVLVVATPCPLILAVPVAIVGGISRAARRGIVVKGGGALEALARAQTVLLDKTGTLTVGSPRVSDVEAFGTEDPNRLVQLAASLDQVSPHVFAPAIVAAARDRGLRLEMPEEVHEETGQGIEGTVAGHRVALGKARWLVGEGELPPAAWAVRRRVAMDGSSSVFVSVDHQLRGALILEDPIRGDAPRAIRTLRRAGVRRVVVATGDHPDVAELVGAAVGADQVLAEQSPADKVKAVLREREHGLTVVVGDGINDAPALAVADVGVAMGVRGASASSEAADVVLTVDRVDRLAEGLRIARRARAIALQSVVVGMGLSLTAMVVAALGFLPPVAGAILQEGIDVLVILNALRVLGERAGHVDVAALEVTARLGREHRELMPMVDRVRRLADRLDQLPPAAVRIELEAVQRELVDRLLPHEASDDREMYPVVARLIGGRDPTAPMSRGHVEIGRLVNVLSRILAAMPETGPDPDDLRHLRRVLYGLHAVLTLHFAQEEEAYLSLLDTEPRRLR
ncbi:MAG TPA: heavy metal translocating P-type ATPase [Candidatus Dormibacteraeota bacterium]|nr:heavy metal translocating P-type ATPase [Candidatus Dormibacteraeota bacterium]